MAVSEYPAYLPASFECCNIYQQPNIKVSFLNLMLYALTYVFIHHQLDDTNSETFQEPLEYGSTTESDSWETVSCSSEENWRDT
jgi:hypothetical protein